MEAKKIDRKRVKTSRYPSGTGKKPSHAGKKGSNSDKKRSGNSGDWLRAGAWIAAICLMACAAVFLLPSSSGIEASQVVINRVMTSNPSTCLSVDGNYYDWIELKNTGDTEMDMSGWKLSDSLDLRGAYVFGEVMLAPQDTLIVYCAERPSDLTGDEIFTGFRLSSDGESLMLADEKQRQIQALNVPAMGAANVYQRDDSTGTYSVVSFFESELESEDYVAALRPEYESDALMISELMPVNRTTLADADGDYSDWIELYNGSNEAVDLSGYAISDDDADHKKWVFPQKILQPGEYLVLFASGKDRTDPNGEMHTNFSLSSAGESVRLYDASGRVISYIEYEKTDEDVSVSRVSGGVLVTDMAPSPGYENSASGARRALGDSYNLVSQNAYGLYINEIMTSDSSGDWIELYNGSDAEIDLSGMGLSDNPARPRKWQFPEGARIPAGGYQVVYLTGTGGFSGYASGKYGADFALSEGETACLSLADGTLVDSVKLYDQYRGVSYGRAQGQERYRYFTTATPGTANAANSYEKRAEKVEFSVPGGLQQGSSLTLTLSAEEGMSIYYTTDGTEPTVSSAVYSGPISIDSNTVVKAVAWRSDVIQSLTNGASYIFGASHSVRLVCVSGNSSELTGSSGTLNTGAKGDGYDVFVEIYEADGTQLVGQNCQLELSGHASRLQFDQKAFMLKAKQAYGENHFNAALFEKRDYTEYKSITMRASGQDNMQTHMRDSILTSLAEDTNVMYQETEVSVVYVNGLYWGIYNMRERITPDSIAQFEGWDNPDDITLVEGDLSRMVSVQGSKKDYQQLIAQVEKTDLSLDENVEKLREYVDIENYLDYVAIQIYTANQDLNNVRMYRNAKEDGQWRWILCDLDLSYQIDRNSINSWLTPGGVGTITQQDNTLFIALMKNAGIRDYFLTRMGELLATTFSTENVVQKIRERYDILLPEMEMHCQRWGWKLSTWQRYGSNMVKYAQTRPAKLIGYFEETLKLSEEQMQKYFGAALAKINGEQ